MMGGLIGPLNLEDGQLMTSNDLITSLSSSNPKTSPPHRMCGIGTSIKAVSFPSTLFIKDSPDSEKRITAFDGYGWLKHRSKLECICGSPFMNVSLQWTILEKEVFILLHLTRFVGCIRRLLLMYFFSALSLWSCGHQSKVDWLFPLGLLLLSLWGDWRLTFHIVKLTDGIVHSMQLCGWCGVSGTNESSKQNPHQWWNLRGGYHPWWLFGKPASRFTSVVDQCSLWFSQGMLRFGLLLYFSSCNYTSTIPPLSLPPCIFPLFIILINCG